MSGPLAEAQVKLRNGSVLTLCFDFDAMVRAEKAMGHGASFIEMVGQRDDEGNQRPPSMEVMRALAFGGLHRHHPDFTLEKLGPLMVKNFQAFSLAVMEGLQSAFGDMDEPPIDDDEEDGDGGNAGADPMKRPKKRGTGTHSSKAGRR